MTRPLSCFRSVVVTQQREVAYKTPAVEVTIERKQSTSSSYQMQTESMSSFNTSAKSSKAASRAGSRSGSRPGSRPSSRGGSRAVSPSTVDSTTDEDDELRKILEESRSRRTKFNQEFYKQWKLMNWLWKNKPNAHIHNHLCWIIQTRKHIYNNHISPKHSFISCIFQNLSCKNTW